MKIRGLNRDTSSAYKVKVTLFGKDGQITGSVHNDFYTVPLRSTFAWISSGNAEGAGGFVPMSWWVDAGYYRVVVGGTDIDVVVDAVVFQNKGDATPTGAKLAASARVAVCVPPLPAGTGGTGVVQAKPDGRLTFKGVDYAARSPPTCSASSWCVAPDETSTFGVSLTKAKNVAIVQLKNGGDAQLKYLVNVPAGGSYRLYLRWAGTAGNDLLVASILGAGGAPVGSDHRASYTFETGFVFGWQGEGKVPGSGDTKVPATWSLCAGLYYVQLGRFDGSSTKNPAVDHLVLQPAAAAAPTDTDYL